MKNKKIIILDYQLGNLFSVKQACIKVGINAEISSDKNSIVNADAIILPGVGAFIEAMSNMHTLDLIEPLKDYVTQSKPLFGVCLGMQLLFTESEEFGNKKGLDFIRGSIQKFPNQNSKNGNIKVPQIGWNMINKSEINWANTAFHDVKEGAFMYFVHSYYAKPDKTDNTLSTTNYEGTSYCSSVKTKNNIFATQFHPEKSGEIGLSIYANWAKINNLI